MRSSCDLPIKIGEGFPVSHISFEDSTNFASLPISEDPNRPVFGKEKVDLFQTLSCSFLSWYQYLMKINKYVAI